MLEDQKIISHTEEGHEQIFEAKESAEQIKPSLRLFTSFCVSQYFQVAIKLVALN